jgi:hypothetical protein
LAKIGCITKMPLSTGDKLGPYEILAPRSGTDQTNLDLISAAARFS